MFDDEDAILSCNTVPTAPGWCVTTLGDGELSDLSQLLLRLAEVDYSGAASRDGCSESELTRRKKV